MVGVVAVRQARRVAMAAASLSPAARRRRRQACTDLERAAPVPGRIESALLAYSLRRARLKQTYESLIGDLLSDYFANRFAFRGQGPGRAQVRSGLRAWGAGGVGRTQSAPGAARGGRTWVLAAWARRRASACCAGVVCPRVAGMALMLAAFALLAFLPGECRPSVEATGVRRAPAFVYPIAGDRLMVRAEVLWVNTRGCRDVPMPQAPEPSVRRSGNGPLSVAFPESGRAEGRLIKPFNFTCSEARHMPYVGWEAVKRKSQVLR